MNLADELKRRRAICDAADSGEWYVCPRLGNVVRQRGNFADAIGTAGDRRDVAIFSGQGSNRGKQSDKDAAFIAHARTGYPETLAALADAVAALEKIERSTMYADNDARAALAQIAGRLGHMDAGREDNQ